MLHAVIQHRPTSGRHSPQRHLHRLDHSSGQGQEGGGGPNGPPLHRAHLKATLSTASLILLTITSANSVPCLPLNPFIAATIPTISSETSRIRPTYSTVPCPLSSPARARISRTRRSRKAWTKPIAA